MNAIVSSSTLVLYSTVESARAVLPADGQHLIVSAKRKETSTGAGFERHVVVRSFAADTATLGEWSQLVNSVLVSTAENVLKDYVERMGTVVTTIPANVFTVDALRSAAIMAATGNMDAETLEREYTASASWQSIVNGEKYKSSDAAKQAAGIFRERVLSLAGKGGGSLSDNDLMVILARLHDEDMQRPIGLYITKKVAELQKRKEKERIEMDADAF
jgi:hypothetical protein